MYFLSTASCFWFLDMTGKASYEIAVTTLSILCFSHFAMTCWCYVPMGLFHALALIPSATPLPPPTMYRYQRRPYSFDCHGDTRNHNSALVINPKNVPVITQARRMPQW